jgi:hypothetical protein
MQYLIQSRDFFAALIPGSEGFEICGGDRIPTKASETVSRPGHCLNP